MNKFLITSYLSSDGQVSSTTSYGEFSKNNNLIKISYESVEEGKTTLTTLFISKNQVRLSRKGQVNYTCILKENEETNFDIIIDAFKLSSTIYCHKIDIFEDDEYFKLILKYDVIMGEKTKTEMHIQVKKGGVLC